MTVKRSGQDDQLEPTPHADLTPLAAHALRVGVDAARPAEAKGKDDEKLHVFWRVFGGTILSIAALVAVTLYNNITTTITDLRSAVDRSNEARAAAVIELRGEMAKAAEARADLLRKEEFNTRLTTLYGRIQELQGHHTTESAALTSLKTEIEGFKERATRNTAEVDAVKKDAAAAIDALKKEQTTTTDALKKDVAALEGLKDRLVALATDFKASRDDFQKLQKDVDKNQAYDLERKERRDVQFKQFDEAMKEVQKGLQDCREKLARLEGQYGPGAPVSPAGGVSPAPKQGPTRVPTTGPKPAEPAPVPRGDGDEPRE